MFFSLPIILLLSLLDCSENINPKVVLPSQVWVAKEGVQGKLEELPIPFSDVRNIIEEIHLEDELTRSRCRAWLVLSSTRYLQADIICPGCKVDFRIMIRPISSEFLRIFKISLQSNAGWNEMFVGSV